MSTYRCLRVGTALVTVLLLSITHRASSQAVPSVPTSARLQSSDWLTRRDAFAELIGASASDYLAGRVTDIPEVLRIALQIDPTPDTRKLGLIALLEVENNLVNASDARARSLQRGLPAEEALSEDYVNYYGDLIAAVSDLHDSRSMPVLLGAIRTGGMVSNALASLGDTAVTPLTAMLTTAGDHLQRSNAAIALWRILETTGKNAPGAASRTMIKRSLMRAASDPHPTVRQATILGLASIGDPETIALVRDMADRDPYQATAETGGSYIVREAASRALARTR